MSGRDLLDPAGRRQTIDPKVKALIDRRLKEGTRSTTIYALERSKDPFWPIGFCVAWVLGRDPSNAARLYARHRLGIGVVHVKGWIDARTSLLRALAAGKVEALGVREADGRRVSIPALEWIDLRIQQRGPYDEVRRADDSIAYRDVRIASVQMLNAWPAPEAVKDEAPENPEIKGGELPARAPAVKGQSDEQRGERSESPAETAAMEMAPEKQESRAGEPPAETPAMKRAREKQQREQACLMVLMERMRADPNVPVPKRELWPNFPGISGRAFDRLFSHASRETGCAAWSKAGRRRRKMTRIDEGDSVGPNHSGSFFLRSKSPRLEKRPRGD
jgi:hypothetical protein